MNNDHIAEKLKDAGESHYRTRGVEPIDLLTAISPHPSLTCGDILALTSLIRYGSRMLIDGLNKADINDCEVYSGWLKYWLAGKEADGQSA